ncbi:unnamed protein product [Ectocarpus sp. 6 AP-2014]
MLWSGKIRFFLAAAAACYALGVVVALVRAWRAGGVKSIYSGRASRDKLLAVVVPVYDGDQDDAMRALSKWPETCHDNTLYGMDLVIYKAEDLEDADHLPQVPHQASRCFRQTKIIDARLLPEITNVGHFDVSDQHVAQAVAQETLFIHGSSLSEGSLAHSINHFGRPTGALSIDVNSLDCTSACGSTLSGKIGTGVSTFCDESCATGWSPAGSRLGGHDCGAGDPSQFGGTCRLCYTDEELALVADRTLASSSANPSKPDAHVVMCDTTQPPPASSCTTACQDAPDTVCDYRCGSGRYGDFNCDWRGLGSTCRLCFNELPAAHLADEFAKAHGGRVVMCNTHEPPPPIGSYTNDKEEEDGHGSADAGNGPTLVAPAPQERNNKEIVSGDEESQGPAATEYIGTTTRGHICAFMRGYSRLLPMMKVSVSSVLQFMPGMRIGITTHPREFEEFNRTFGHLPNVTVGTSTNVEHGPLVADYVCGEGTRLIYYMDAGEMLSRTFTKKDTHTVTGDLIVSLVNTDEVPQPTAARGMGSSVLLGVTTPTFTHGSDLILPAETNAQLRAVLEGNQKLVARTDAKHGHSDRVERIYEYLADVASTHKDSAVINIPEVLAALAYSRSPPGVTFVNMNEWSHQNLFSEASIWDVPMVKPRFGCSFDRSLGNQGYDMGEILAKELEAFKLGASCERGFKAIEVSSLSVKANRQLSVQGAEQKVPEFLDYDVTVMYRTFVGDAKLFNASIASVIEHVSSAFEVVVVVVEADVGFFESIVQPFRIAAPFPIRVIGEPELMDGKLQQKYSKLRADLYTEGDYILHLDSDAVVFQDLSFAHMFHLGKPVLPFRRYEKNRGLEGWTETMCWESGISSAIGEDVIHDFGVLNTHLYPRSMYPAAREFIEQHHEMPFVDFMASRRGSCMHPGTETERTQDERALVFSDSNFVGAYLW